jgi:hypothetical protein
MRLHCVSQFHSSAVTVQIALTIYRINLNKVSQRARQLNALNKTCYSVNSHFLNCVEVLKIILHAFQSLIWILFSFHVISSAIIRF